MESIPNTVNCLFGSACSALIHSRCHGRLTAVLFGSPETSAFHNGGIAHNRRVSQGGSEGSNGSVYQEMEYSSSSFVHPFVLPLYPEWKNDCSVKARYMHAAAHFSAVVFSRAK